MTFQSSNLQRKEKCYRRYFVAGRGMYRFHKPYCSEIDFQVFSKEKEIHAAFPAHIYGETLTL